MTPSTDVTFNLQTYLHDRFEEQRDALTDMAEKIETGFSHAAIKLEEHKDADNKRFEAIEDRVDPLERTYRSVKWAALTAVGAIITYTVTHLPGWITHVARG